MQGSSLTTARPPESRTSSPRAGADPDQVAERLSGEFGAPVGVLDPSRGVWCARAGAGADRLPEAGAGLLSALAAEGLGPGRAAVWCADREAGPAWLAVPVPRPEGGDLVALAGFATSLDAPGAPDWGPSCPVAALRAWGQAVADQLRGEATARLISATGSARVDGGERLLIARLIRRSKISDPPERFQNLAAHALRHALNVAAVAWVPGHPHEPVIVSGELAGMKPGGYRALVPSARNGPVHIDNRPAVAAEGAPRRVIAVAADSQGAAGWLVAVDPLDGRPFTLGEVELLQPAASLIASQQANSRLYADLKELLFGVIRALTAAIDAKDPYTSGHSERVARIAVRLAEELGMPANQRSDLYLMGLLHDVGKIGIDDNVLKKAGPLTPAEYRLIQSHVEIGVHILTDLKKLHHLLPGVRHHHESLDGKGYPDGLAGQAIPLEARILAVADSFDAMSSTRPYRKRLTPMQIDEILRKGSGIQWDPKIVDALFACRADIEHIRQKGLGESLQIVVNDTLGRP
jgi:HD-GYP domain-containing protein (c-di-GMP phosphodiesterase class II)